MKLLKLDDKFLRYILVLFLLGIIVSCSGALESNKTPDNINRILKTDVDSISNDYPDVILKGNLQEAYDNAKWSLYLYYCTDTSKNEDGTYRYKIPKPLSVYSLAFDSLYQNKDTFICFLYFLIDNSDQSERRSNAICIVDNPNYRCIYNKTMPGLDPSSVCVNRTNNIDKNGQLSTKKIPGIQRTIEERLFNPLTPEVIAFINQNQKDLNPWFVEQAKKRGVIK